MNNDNIGGGKGSTSLVCDGVAIEKDANISVFLVQCGFQLGGQILQIQLVGQRSNRSQDYVEGHFVGMVRKIKDEEQNEAGLGGSNACYCGNMGFEKLQKTNSNQQKQQNV